MDEVKIDWDRDDRLSQFIHVSVTTQGNPSLAEVSAEELARFKDMVAGSVREIICLNIDVRLRPHITAKIDSAIKDMPPQAIAYYVREDDCFEVTWSRKKSQVKCGERFRIRKNRIAKVQPPPRKE